MSLDKTPKLEFPDNYNYHYDPVLTPPSFGDHMNNSSPSSDFRDQNLGNEYSHENLISPVAMVEEAAKKRETRLERIIKLKSLEFKKKIINNFFL